MVIQVLPKSPLSDQEARVLPVVLPGGLWEADFRELDEALSCAEAFLMSVPLFSSIYTILAAAGQLEASFLYSPRLFTDR